MTSLLMNILYDCTDVKDVCVYCRWVHLFCDGHPMVPLWLHQWRDFISGRRWFIRGQSQCVAPESVFMYPCMYFTSIKKHWLNIAFVSLFVIHIQYTNCKPAVSFSRSNDYIDPLTLVQCSYFFLFIWSMGKSENYCLHFLIHGLIWFERIM